MNFSNELEKICMINEWGFINHLNRRFEVSVLRCDDDDEFIITELIKLTAKNCNINVVVVWQQYVENFYTVFVDVI